MTPSIVRDNARLSHVALTRVNSTLDNFLHSIPPCFTGTGGMKIVPKNRREHKVF